MELELVFLILGGIVILFVFSYFVPINLWMTALFAGVRIELTELVFMRIRRTPVKEIVNGLVSCAKAGVLTNALELESHALAGGDVIAVTKTMIKAKAGGVEISFKELSDQNLAGNDLSHFLDKKKNQMHSFDIRTDLCEKIMNEFTEDQVKDLEKYTSRFN